MAEIDWGEARRYLGLHRPGGTVDEHTEAELRLCGAELERTARPRAVWKVFPLTLGEGTAALAGLTFDSRSLRRHLDGCAQAALFAATLGVECDRLLRRYGASDMGRAVMVQACAASLLEVYCDQCCEKLSAETGRYLRPRFSPGYGDWPVRDQRGILDALEAGKRIGLNATEALMLTPTKSVTAVVGLADTPWCGAKGCASCEKRDCTFRRSTEPQS